MKFRENWELGRPPGVEKKSEKVLFNVALAYRDELRSQLVEINAPVFQIAPAAVDDLAVALAGLAEDLHADAGLWRSIETSNTQLFGVPLPLVCREGDEGLETFDARRFRFFLYSLWRHFLPNVIVSPAHRGFLALSEHAATFFSAAFGRLPRKSPVAEYLGRQNHRGWSVKQKLIWLGTRSFLFRLFHGDYVARIEPEPGAEINTTDDFLCQECTEWSGFGVVDILAVVLELSDEDRETLRGWQERHVAVYRIVNSIQEGRKEVVVETVNEANGQTYRVRIGLDQGANPFLPGMFVYGSLVPWRGEWYWSGSQRIVQLSPVELADVRKKLRQTGSFSYRYCPDLERKAREFELKQRANFLQFHGSDLALFANGAVAAAAESKRVGLPGMCQEIKGAKDKTAVFYHSGEGVEIFTAYGTLRSALEKRDEDLSEDEIETLQAFIEEDTVSPAFVRRVIDETGSAAVEELFYLPKESIGVEYLLRRFKGCFFRKRYPNISLRE